MKNSNQATADPMQKKMEIENAKKTTMPPSTSRQVKSPMPKMAGSQPSAFDPDGDGDDDSKDPDEAAEAMQQRSGKSAVAKHNSSARKNRQIPGANMEEFGSFIDKVKGDRKTQRKADKKENKKLGFAK